MNLERTTIVGIFTLGSAWSCARVSTARRLSSALVAAGAAAGATGAVVLLAILKKWFQMKDLVHRQPIAHDFCSLFWWTRSNRYHMYRHQRMRCRLCEIMRDYARLCESTQVFASLAYVCEAPFFASYASSHAKKNATTSLLKWSLNSHSTTKKLFYRCPHRLHHFRGEKWWGLWIGLLLVKVLGPSFSLSNFKIN